MSRNRNTSGNEEPKETPAQKFFREREEKRKKREKREAKRKAREAKKKGIKNVIRNYYWNLYLAIGSWDYSIHRPML